MRETKDSTSAASFTKPLIAEVEPKRKPHYVRGCATIAAIFVYLIITKQPNPPIALQNIMAWLTTPQHLTNLTSAAVGVISAHAYAPLRKKKTNETDDLRCVHPSPCCITKAEKHLLDKQRDNE
jgi:hypothetical protein